MFSSYSHLIRVKNRDVLKYLFRCSQGPTHSRPVIESHIATLLSRGAGTVRYKGLEGAVVQQGMTVMSYNGAVLARIRQQKMTKRAQKFRRLLGLKSPKVSKIKQEKKLIVTTYI